MQKLRKEKKGKEAKKGINAVINQWVIYIQQSKKSAGFTGKM